MVRDISQFLENRLQFFLASDKQNMSVGQFVIPSVDSHGQVLIAQVRSIPMRCENNELYSNSSIT